MEELGNSRDVSTTPFPSSTNEYPYSTTKNSSMQSKNGSEALNGN